jgi:WD40 repeat protein
VNLTTTGTAQSMSWSPTGKLLATITKDADDVVLWDPETAHEERRLKVSAFHSNTGQALAFTPDGSRLAVACDDVNLLNPKDGQGAGGIQKRPPSHMNWGAARWLTFTPKGDWLIVRTNSSNLHIWPVRNGAPDDTLKHKYLDVGCQAVAVAEDNHTLAVGSADGSVGLYSLDKLPTFEGN